LGIVGCHDAMTHATSPQSALIDAIDSLQAFGGQDLTQTLARIEASLHGVSQNNYAAVLATCGAKAEVLRAAGLLKQLVGQINVVIHALGILLCLPHILNPDEVIRYVSLGAGNAGRAFDLETNQRIAEFKFIHWQGGSETIRQNSLFKDFYQMVEHATDKQKYLYVLGTGHVDRFFNGGRAISSVLSRNVKLGREFTNKHGERYSKVRDYYLVNRNAVVIEDVSVLVPELFAAVVEVAEVEGE
jgi:hypothetical protein